MRQFFKLFVAVLLASLLAGCGYNDIQRLDEGVKASWSETLNQYQRRADLVPQLVESVNTYMVHGRELLTRWPRHELASAH